MKVTQKGFTWSGGHDRLNCLGDTSLLGEDKKSAARRHFDAAHELGHLLMHLNSQSRELI
ncbi:ImmA/IrrE family metallo-endopeptidase [Paenibacillus sp. UNC451MF]|uniref:ImmA/IrrE family metallo-endopeptidase n=1 Tax=Paenibacillus sp. UNC451MF TaxID=1449063 RepID=UPI003FA6D32D